MTTFRIDLSGAAAHDDFVRAFNAGFARPAGGDWRGRSMDAFEDLLRWVEGPYTLALVNASGLPESLRHDIAAICAANPQVDLRWEEDRSAVPYGVDLATAVAHALASGTQIIHAHRDYCGMGLRMLPDGRFCYGQVMEGYLDLQSDPDAQLFATPDAFIAWLAAQSDASLDGREHPDPFYRRNQRITRARLEAAVKGRS